MIPYDVNYDLLITNKINSVKCLLKRMTEPKSTRCTLLLEIYVGSVDVLYEP